MNTCREGEWYRGGSGRRVTPATMTPWKKAVLVRPPGDATLIQHSRAAGVLNRSASQAHTVATTESVCRPLVHGLGKLLTVTVANTAGACRHGR
jgi:hypothetical protein